MRLVGFLISLILALPSVLLADLTPPIGETSSPIIIAAGSSTFCSFITPTGPSFLYLENNTLKNESYSQTIVRLAKSKQKKIQNRKKAKLAGKATKVTLLKFQIAEIKKSIAKVKSCYSTPPNNVLAMKSLDNEGVNREILTISSINPNPINFVSLDESGFATITLKGAGFKESFSGDLNIPFSTLVVNIKETGKMALYPFSYINSNTIEIRSLPTDEIFTAQFLVVNYSNGKLTSSNLFDALVDGSNNSDDSAAAPKILGASSNPVQASNEKFIFSLDVNNLITDNTIGNATLYVEFGGYKGILPYIVTNPNKITISVDALWTGTAKFQIVNYPINKQSSESNIFSLTFIGEDDSVTNDPNEEEPTPTPDNSTPYPTPTPGSTTVGPWPLIIQEALDTNGSGGITRTGEVSTFGIPLPKGLVSEVDSRPALAIAGAIVFQIDTLERWDDGSVKGALVHVAADVNAGSQNSGFAVVPGIGASSQENVGSTALDKIILDSGVLKAEILPNSSFNILDKVTVNGVVVVKPGTSPGIIAKDEFGDSLVPSNITSQFEYNGPAKAVLRIDGSLSNGVADLIDFTCRFTLARGSKDIDVTFTIRNANISRPQHRILDYVELGIQTDLGTSLVASLPKHDNTEVTVNNLSAGSELRLHQAYSSADVEGEDGTGTYYVPHLFKVISNNTWYFPDTGYRITQDGAALFTNLDKTKFPRRGYGELSGSKGGAVVALRHMPYWYPASISINGDGLLKAGIFPESNTNPELGDHVPFTFIWRGHENRDVRFSFDNAAMDGAAISKKFDYPIVGRLADFTLYDNARVFNYRLVSPDQQNQVYQVLGIKNAQGIVHNIKTSVLNDVLRTKAYQYAHETGGANNEDLSERRLLTEWLGLGLGGRYLSGLDLVRYKTEWNIPRSDNFDHSQDPGATNNQIPHTIGTFVDLEHRYHGGSIAAYYLTGDIRIKEALFDAAEEILPIKFTAYERAAYQTLRGLALLYEFTKEPALKSRLEYWFTSFEQGPVSLSTPGKIGWESMTPNLATRGYYVNFLSGPEKITNNNYVTRGFITATLGPIAFYQTARILGENTPLGKQARGRLQNVALFTKNELYPGTDAADLTNIADPTFLSNLLQNMNPTTRNLVYSYGPQTRAYATIANGHHPISLGMCEAWRETGDSTYLQRAIEQIDALKAQDHSTGTDDMDDLESRPDFVHMIQCLREWLGLE